MVGKIRVVHYGLGPIGAAIAKLILRKKGFEIVGAIDIADNLFGMDLGDAIGASKKLGIKIYSDPKKILKKTKPNLVVHSTSSHLKTIFPQIQAVISARSNLISTCEELVYPYYTNRKLGRRIDNLAKRNHVTILGTGVNPGYAMDTLALVMSGVCQHIQKVSATRIVDAGLRRLPLQKKIGAALTEEEFRTKAREGKIGHAGLRESVALVADTVGWSLDDIRQNIQPVIAHEFVKSEYFEIPPGRVTGLRQTALGFTGNTELVNLHLEMYVGAKNSVDSIYIDGTPEVQMQVPGGLHGDLATASIVVNMIPRVLSASPGLKTMATLPPPASYVNDIRKHL